jgi:hypothetical protein
VDPLRPIGPRTDVEAVERVPLIGPREREERRREREERRRKRSRDGAAGPLDARDDDDRPRLDVRA